jgi:hypothetical protein
MPFYALRMKLKCLSQEHFGNSTIEVGKLMTSELLGFRSSQTKAQAKPDKPAYKVFHTCGHRMGPRHTMVESWLNLCKANMVFTIEPGIYIPRWRFRNTLGRRPHDSRSGEPFNLMRNIPIEVDEIEKFDELVGLRIKMKQTSKLVLIWFSKQCRCRMNKVAMKNNTLGAAP